MNKSFAQDDAQEFAPHFPKVEKVDFFKSGYIIMSSTSNKNTPGNYCLESRQYKQFENYTLYKHSAGGYAYDTKIAGDGVLQGAMPWDKLSYNAPDVESFLFGIGTSNLVNPMKSFTPELAQNSSQNFFQKSPVYIPDPLVVEKSQRPGYLD